MRLGDRSGVAYLLVVLAGVWISHGLAYLVAHLDPAVRAASLSGHGYLDLAGALLMPAAAMALGWFAVQESREAGLGSRIRPIRLALVQMPVFVAMEFVERLPTGTLDQLLGEPALYLGLALITPITVLLVWLIDAVSLIASALRDPRHKRPSGSQLSWVPKPSSSPIVTSRLGSLSRRGPPRPVGSR